ncbi:hypothetical protein K501DRAFT_196638 [Backusella circina FSU 941]|nr:hypothetical protein K501DRAFT_196638 [Backusella circina FSU 941]
MAPEPTCQHCNEQFIEELHSDDDPREFLAGAETYNQNNENPQESTDGAPLQTGGTTLFSFGPRPREQDSGELGDEVFQFFTPRSATGNDENRTTGEGGPAPLVNMLQNMLTNIIGDNIEGRGDSNQPMLFYGDYVDGNFRFRSANSQNAPQNTTETTSQGASANENQQDSNENGGNEGEEPTGGARINGVNR